MTGAEGYALNSLESSHPPKDTEEDVDDDEVSEDDEFEGDEFEDEDGTTEI